MSKVLVLFWCSIGFLGCMSHVTFTNLKCTTFNESIVEFSECRIRAVNRTHKYIVISAKLKTQIVSNLMVNLKLMRHDHGYKPFFFDITVDGCKYLKKPNNIIAGLFYETFRGFSNLNHTCPYNHDIIVDKLWTGNQDASFAKYLPVPNGDYIMSLNFLLYNTDLCKVLVYIKRSS